MLETCVGVLVEGGQESVRLQISNAMKTIIAAVGIAMLGSRVFADGFVGFSNNVSTRIFIYDYATLTANPVTQGPLGPQDGGSSTGILTVGLVWGTSANSVNTLAATSFIDFMPGVFAGDAHYGISGTNPGDTDYFQVFAWDSSFGTSLAGMNACIAAGGIFGAATGTPGVYGSIGTPLAFTLAGVPPASAPLFGTSPGFFTGFTVMSAPEPLPVALAGSGAIALLLFRRRN
jgi:hypothetical protein